MAAYQDHILGQWTSGKKSMKLNTRVIDPHFQRQGISTMSLRWGTNLTDNDHDPSYLASTSSTYAVYYAYGF